MVLETYIVNIYSVDWVGSVLTTKSNTSDFSACSPTSFHHGCMDWICQISISTDTHLFGSDFYHNIIIEIPGFTIAIHWAAAVHQLGFWHFSNPWHNVILNTIKTILGRYTDFHFEGKKEVIGTLSLLFSIYPELRYQYWERKSWIGASLVFFHTFNDNIWWWHVLGSQPIVSGLLW